MVLMSPLKKQPLLEKYLSRIWAFFSAIFNANDTIRDYEQWQICGEDSYHIEEYFCCEQRQREHSRIHAFRETFSLGA